MKKFYQSKPQRIEKGTEEMIIADFWPFEMEDDLVEKVKSFKTKDYFLNATALCLYANLLHTGYFEENDKDEEGKRFVKELKPKYSKRKIDAIKSLRTKKDYANLSKEEFEKKIEEITMRDLRNCFSHGNFEIRAKNSIFEAEFVLNPNQSSIVSDGKIVISFENVFNAIAKLLSERAQEYLNTDIFKTIAKSIKNGDKDALKVEDFKKMFEQNTGKMLQDVIMPTTLQEMTRYFSGQEYNPSIFNNKKMEAIYLRNILLATMFTYNQNEYYNIFGKDSEVFKAVSLIRNSLAHNNTEFTGDGTRQKLKNDYKNKVTEIEDDLLEISLKMEIINYQKKLTKLKPDAENFVCENFLSKKQSIEKLNETLEKIMVSAYGEKVLKLANEKTK